MGASREKGEETVWHDFMTRWLLGQACIVDADNLLKSRTIQMYHFLLTGFYSIRCCDVNRMQVEHILTGRDD